MRMDLSRIELLVLATLTEKESYGLEIIEAVKRVTGGRTRLALGSLYMTLHRMEGRGFILSRWEEPDETGKARRKGRPRRYYHITPQGLEALAEAKGFFARVFGLIPTLAPATTSALGAEPSRG